MATTSFQDGIKSSIGNSIKETSEQLSERIEPHLREGKRRLLSLNEQARTLINDHPAACLFGALALGYVVARVARSPKR